MIEKLNTLYLSHLKLGFIILREAKNSGSLDWLNAEIEFLHNIPTLIGEDNRFRHLYFWNEERGLYLDRIAVISNTDANSKIQTYYKPLWNEMGPIIKQLEEIKS